VRGITTAATIWASAAIGMAIGRELYLVAGLGTVLVFIVLEARPITRRVDAAIRRRTRELSEELEQAITSSHLDEIEQEKDQDD
jgi:putative Mg2+ transporter-C (MgtC) family protein